MGYRSEVYIAVSKELYVKCQLLNNIPKWLLDNIECFKTDDAVYFFIEGWKWYNAYPEIQEMEVWFNWCNDEDENPPTIQHVPIFGAIRLGEGTENSELDVEEWGDPGHFDLYVQTSLSRP